MMAPTAKPKLSSGLIVFLQFFTSAFNIHSLLNRPSCLRVSRWFLHALFVQRRIPALNEKGRIIENSIGTSGLFPESTNSSQRAEPKYW